MSTDYCNEDPCTHHDQKPLHPVCTLCGERHDPNKYEHHDIYCICSRCCGPA